VQGQGGLEQRRVKLPIQPIIRYGE